MMDNGQFAADLLTASAAGLAALAADRLVESRPRIEDRYGLRPTLAWRDCLNSRIGYLSAALGTACPGVFVEQAVWASTAYAARGGPEAADDFLQSQVCLRDVLQEQLPADAARLAASYVDHALDTLRLGVTQPREVLDPKTRCGRLGTEYLLALLGGERRKAAAHIMAAARGTDGRPAIPVRQIYLEVLLPAQLELGRMWHLNEIGVAEEHFATATTQLVMSQLFELLDFAPSNGRVAVAASVEGNAHDVGVRMLSDMMEAEGWRVMYLGPSVPPADLAQAAEIFKADLVAVSAGLGCQLPSVVGTIEAIRASSPNGAGVKIMVGGGGFAGAIEPGSQPLWRRIGADGFAATVEEGVRLAATLCGVQNETGRA